VKLAYRLGNNGSQLEITSESEGDSATLREFGQAAIENDFQLRMERVSWDTSDKAVQSITIETVPPPSDSMGTFPVGYSVHGWADHYVDQSQSGTVQWDYELEVRPPRAPKHREPPHSFIARTRVTTSAWDRDAEKGEGGWVRIDGPSIVYYGEHASLAAGVKAVQKAYSRARLLREGPEDL
jgi:hypothetical protein